MSETEQQLQVSQQEEIAEEPQKQEEQVEVEQIENPVVDKQEEEPKESEILVSEIKPIKEEEQAPFVIEEKEEFKPPTPQERTRQKQTSFVPIIRDPDEKKPTNNTKEKTQSTQFQSPTNTQHSFKPKQKITRVIQFYKLKTKFKDSDQLLTSSGNLFFSSNQLFVNSAGLAHNISSSTLQHASPQFSFPKQNRFQSQAQLTTASLLELPSCRHFRTTTQGFGNKQLFQYRWQEMKAKTFPSPDRYEVARESGIDANKKSFGVPFECYAKTYLPYNKHIPPETAKFMPGPGEYNVRKELAIHRYQFQLKGKGRMVNDVKDNGVPGPQTYTPIHKISSPSRFNAITLGIGEKKSPFSSKSQTPGPGRYTLPSPFDKFTRKTAIQIIKDVEKN